MSSTSKGNDWYFGSEADRKSIRGIDFPTNAHIGVDVDSGVSRSLDTTTAKLLDSQVRDALLHGEETSVRAGLPLVRRRQRCPDRRRSRWQLRATMATAMSAPGARRRSKRRARSGAFGALPGRSAL